MKKFTLLITVVMLCACTCCAFASNDLDVHLERVHVRIDGSEELVGLETWLDSQAEVLGYRPSWDLIVLSENVAIVPLHESILEIEIEKGEDFNPLVPKKALDKLVIEQNELYSQYPDGSYSVGSIKETEYRKIVSYWAEDGAHLCVIDKPDNLLYKELITKEYQLVQGDFIVNSELYRQLRYYLD